MQEKTRVILSLQYLPFDEFFFFQEHSFFLYWEETGNELFTSYLEPIPLSLYLVIGSLNSQLKMSV